MRMKYDGMNACVIKVQSGSFGVGMTTTAYSIGLQGPEGVIWGKNDIQWYECKHQ